MAEAAVSNPMHKKGTEKTAAVDPEEGSLKKKWLAVVLTILAVGGAFSASVVLSGRQERTATEATSQLKTTSYFYVDYLRESLILARTGDTIGFLVETGANFTVIAPELETLRRTTANIQDLLDDLIRAQDKAKERAPALRGADEKFDRFRRSIEDVVALTEQYIALFIIDPSAALPLLSQVQYFAVGQPGFDGQRSELDENLRSYYTAVSRVDRDVRTTSFHVSLVAFGVTLVALGSLLLLMLRFVEASYFRREAIAKLEAQEKLMRSQSHEMRTRFSPAIFMMESFMEATTETEYQNLKNDMHSALTLLREVQVQHQTRLDCYKILRGNYEVKHETIDLLVFLHERASAERTIAAAKARSEHRSLDVKFRVGVPRSLVKGSIHVKTDAYILAHVMTNLLSNARKHCHVGNVTAFFHGQNPAGLLIFRVRDSGVGVPEKIRHQLFKREVTTGADVRGTGLGLASAGLFCETAGGYCKLVDTRLQNNQGVDGWTLFEFAIAGTLLDDDSSSPLSRDALGPEDFIIVDADTNLPFFSQQMEPLTNKEDEHKLPADVKVVIVDDSRINRLCIRKSLEKLAPNWTYTEFETIEESQSTLRNLKDDPLALVTLDQHLNSRGGVMTGTDAVTWLQSIHFAGIIVSATGDDDDSKDHIALGAQFAWGKPIPTVDTMKSDLLTAFSDHLRIQVDDIL